MKTWLLFAGVGAALAALVTQPACAQTSSSSTSSSTTVTVPIYGAVPGTGGPVSTDPNGYSPYNTHTVLENQGIPHQAPAISAPSVYGLNPCSVGASLGVSTPLVGVSGAISTTDADCEARNNAALAITAFHNEFLAREVVCTIKAFREAWMRIGKPCLIDQPRKAVASLAEPGTQPIHPVSANGAVTPQGLVPVGGAMVPAGTVPATPAQDLEKPALPPQSRKATGAQEAHARPDWCGVVSEADLKARPSIRQQCQG